MSASPSSPTRSAPSLRIESFAFQTLRRSSKPSQRPIADGDGVCVVEHTARVPVDTVVAVVPEVTGFLAAVSGSGPGSPRTGCGLGLATPPATGRPSARRTPRHWPRRTGASDVLIAYGAAVSAMESTPRTWSPRSWPRRPSTGWSERTSTGLSDGVLARHDVTADVSVRLREDTAALVARLAMQDALATEGDDRPARLPQSATCTKRLPTGMTAFHADQHCDAAAVSRVTSRGLASGRSLVWPRRDSNPRPSDP